MSACVVLLAAGQSRRFGPSSGTPKQFRLLLGKPLFFWPLLVFEKMPSVKDVVFVVSRSRLKWAASFVMKHKLRKVAAVVEGGKERADSVRSGVRAVPDGVDVILIHDSARALVTADVVGRVIDGARRTGAALAAWPAPDTLKSARLSSEKFRVAKTVPRKNLWLAQTPQGFRREVLEGLLKNVRGKFTDDVQMAEKSGRAVEIVRGSSFNFKVTVPEDFKMCEAVLRMRKSQ